MNDYDIKICPHCQAVIEKIEGCPSMKCGYCRHKFCWNCLKLDKDIQLLDSHECEEYGTFNEDDNSSDPESSDSD